MWIIKVIIIAFFFVSSGILISAYFKYNTANKFVNQAIKTEGLIKEILNFTSPGSKHKEKLLNYNTTFALDIEFQTLTGTTIRFTTGTNNFSLSKYNVGKIVNIYYLENDPEHALVDETAELYFWPVLMAVFGGILFGISLIGIYALLKFPNLFS